MTSCLKQRWNRFEFCSYCLANFILELSLEKSLFDFSENSLIYVDNHSKKRYDINKLHLKGKKSNVYTK